MYFRSSKCRAVVLTKAGQPFPLRLVRGENPSPLLGENCQAEVRLAADRMRGGAHTSSTAPRVRCRPPFAFDVHIWTLAFGCLIKDRYFHAPNRHATAFGDMLRIRAFV